MTLLSLAFALFWVPVIVFVNLADEVIEREPLPGDVLILGAAHAAQSPVLTNIFLFITSLGEPLTVASIGFGIVLFLLTMRRYRAVAMLAAGVGGAALANLLLKLLFTRARPTEFAALITEKTYSFPSGHAMVSSAFILTGILLMWHTKYRLPAIIGGTILALLIGFSRVYLGVHYPSDVVAGWAVSIIWVAITGSLVLNRPWPLGRVIMNALARRRPAATRRHR